LNEDTIKKLKKLNDNDLLNKSIVYNEAKPFIVEHLIKGYSYDKILKLLEMELNEAGIDIELSSESFVSWRYRINKYTGKKNLDLDEIKNYKKEPDFKAVKENATTNKKVEVFKNLVK